MPKKPRIAKDEAPLIPYRAFTMKAHGPMTSLWLNVGITAPVAEPEGMPDAQVTPYVGAIDTSQPTTQISQRVVDKLRLSQTMLRGHGVYIVDVYLPNRIRFSGVPTVLLDDPKKDCVLGMDILLCGDMAVSNAGGQTTFSFRVPPSGVVDFVEEHSAKSAEARGATPMRRGAITMADRNQLCPCGSGKKHKNCCGRYQH